MQSPLPSPSLLRSPSGAGTLEVAIGLSLLVIGFVMPVTGLIQKVTMTDSYSEAAREAAEAVALLESAPADAAALQVVLCDAVKRSLARPDAVCADEWVIELQAYATPDALTADPPTPRTSGSPGGEDNDIVLVRLFLTEAPMWHLLFPDPAYANAQPDARGAQGPPVGIGFARNGRGAGAP